jgi:N-hydroxyarylamine O-acetyltransferase
MLRPPQSVAGFMMALRDDDLASYLDRIAYAGPRRPDLETLSGVVAAHATAIPFENIDVLLGRGVRLDTPSLTGKLVRGGRGGYCFEHNTLLQHALRALGFRVEGFSARVLWGRPEGDPTGRSHMLLKVALPEGDFIADVGFGGLTLTVPLRFVIGPEQATPHEPHRLVGNDGEIELQARLDGEWSPLYHFLALPQLPVDYEQANWFTATYPEGLFTNHLMMARPTPDRRYALFDRAFTVRHRDGRVERRTLNSAADLADVLTRCFRVKLADAAEAEAIWRRLPG